jgi:serine/threonine protein kinase
MELVDGRTLARVLEQEGKPNGLPEARVREWAVQLCEVLAYLHERKPHAVVFRDLKPTNIMLTRDEEIRLIDFGIARAFQEGTGTQVMTLGYAPLEQIKGKAEPRSDMYALGATLHHLLTGRKPTGEEFVPVRLLRAEVSVAFEAVVQKALQEDLAARWASAREMGAALRALPPMR